MESSVLLEGSCHCGKTSFSVESNTPAPFMQCYCSICRKCQGGGGYAVNIMGLSKGLKVSGKEYIREYRAIRDKKSGELCGNIRYFCGECGSHLYAYDEEYSDYVYPMASAIDSSLPSVDPKDVYHIMLNKESKASWVPAPSIGKKNHAFKDYPDESIASWHEKHKNELQ